MVLFLLLMIFNQFILQNRFNNIFSIWYIIRQYKIIIYSFKKSNFIQTSKNHDYPQILTDHSKITAIIIFTIIHFLFPLFWFFSYDFNFWISFNNPSSPQAHFLANPIYPDRIVGHLKWATSLKKKQFPKSLMNAKEAAPSTSTTPDYWQSTTPRVLRSSSMVSQTACTVLLLIQEKTKISTQYWSSLC